MNIGDSLDSSNEHLDDTDPLTGSNEMTVEELAVYLKSHPLSLMAQNVDISVFSDTDVKNSFESLFRVHSAIPEDITFNYLPSFRRVRINFPVGYDAICAKIALHQTEICGSHTNVYIADQPLPPVGELCVPKSDKMFLISPPPSPPVGWESAYEEAPHPAPVLDLGPATITDAEVVREVASRVSAIDSLQLLTAFAHQYSKPGEVVEVLPSDEGNPSIMVTSVDGPSSPSYDESGEIIRIGNIPQTPCPPHPSSIGDITDDVLT